MRGWWRAGVMAVALICGTPQAPASLGVITSKTPTATHGVDLAPSVESYEDAGGDLTFHQAREQAYRPASAAFGFSPSAHWVRVRVRNSEPTPVLWWLDTGNRTLQELDLYVTDGRGQTSHQSASSKLPFRQRPLPFPDFVFPVEIPAGEEVTLYLRLRSTGYLHAAVHPRLWEPDAYRSHTQTERSHWLLYVGMGIALALLNLSLFAAVRDGLYLRYVASVVCVVWAISTSEGGYGWMFPALWPDMPRFEQAGWVASTLLSAYFTVQFVTRLTDVSTHLPRTLRVIQGSLAAVVIILGFQAAATLADLRVPASVLQPLHVLGTLPYTVMMLTVLGALGVLAWRGHRAARIAVVAFFPLIVAATVTSAQVTMGDKSALLPVLVCSAWELLVMAIALADRFNQEKQARLAAQDEVVATLRRSERELEAKVAQRTSELQEEKARATGLLHNILPVQTAEELSATGRARTVRYEAASILFTDFSGFTQAVSTMPADRMVGELNEIFAAFDDIADDCGIEKIKTIGDAYMAAGGLPVACPDHAQRCVAAGLRMVSYLNARNEHAAFKWQLRVGIHSGPVIAGVVGKRKYAYDIWGDSVNIASRMESSGEPGRVNVSAYTFDLIRANYRCEYRGKVEAKGKGAVDMYFVVASLDGSETSNATAEAALK